MKKLIAILVVFAVVAGAAFAQDAGTWSISGNGQIGTRINFLPLFNDPLVTSNHATIYANNYGLGDGDGNGDQRGNLSLNYTKGIIAVGISFNQRGAIGANVQANGENFQFRASKDLADLLLANKLDPNASTGIDLRGIGDLWGNYTFNLLEGLTVELAVNRESEQWTVENILGDSFSKNIGGKRSYALVNVKPMAGLEVGFKLPNVFNVNDYGTGFNGSAISNSTDFLDETLRRAVFGAKYSTGPIGVAFQFALSKYGLWTGATGTTPVSGTFTGIRLEAKYTINSQMWAAVDFKGQFNFKNSWDKVTGTDRKRVDDPYIGFGFKFNFAQDALNADLTLKYEKNAVTVSTESDYGNSLFSVSANVGYKIAPSLQAKLGIGLGIPILGEKAKSKTFADNMQYTFTPELVYTFGPSSISVGYRVQGRAEQSKPAHSQNHLNIMFKWGF